MTLHDAHLLRLRYRPGAATIDDLRAEITSALVELSEPGSELSREASSLGVNSSEFMRSEGLVDQEGKGFGDVVIAIVIIAPSINHALRNVWDDLIWPRVKSRLGADALGGEISEIKRDGDHEQIEK